MKRDVRLHGLSSDHHHALVLARELLQRETPWTAEDGAALQRRFDAELAPHFLVEETLLLPALSDLGAESFVARTREDHAALRAMLAAARAGDGGAAMRFGERLKHHVHFEELELFPLCEKRLPAAVLAEVAQRAPKPG